MILLKSKVARFFFNPSFNNPEITFRRKVSNLRLALKFEFQGYVLWILIVLIEHSIAVLLKKKSFFSSLASNYTGLEGMSTYELFLWAVILAPIIEELAFRGFMSFKRRMISLTAAALLFCLLRMFFKPYFDWWGMAATSIAFYFCSDFSLKNEKISTFIFAKKSVIFYFMAILFAMLHTNNYTAGTFNNYNFLLIPFAVSPQFIAAISLSFLRLKNGLIWSIFAHAFVNFLITCVYVLSQGLMF
jgi:hypothetical protein